MEKERNKFMDAITPDFEDPDWKFWAFMGLLTAASLGLVYLKREKK